MIYIHCSLDSSFGDVKRRIGGVYEISKVKTGKPLAKILHRWLPESDTFERIERPVLLTASEHTIHERSKKIQMLVSTSSTGPAEIKKLKLAFQSSCG